MVINAKNSKIIVKKKRNFQYIKSLGFSNKAKKKKNVIR